MTIVPQSTLNTAALTVPDLYVVVVPPQTILLNGLPSNIIGIVGTAAWGPVNQPVIVGDMPSYVRSFGPPINRKYDMGTHVATAVQQAANAFRCVRVSDGTDVAAGSTGVSGCITFSAKYTGSLGNSLTVQLTGGSKAGSWKALVGVPGGQNESFDNVVGTGNAFWVNLANAINLGNNQLRGASQLIVATAGGGTTSPSAATYTFTGGVDGTSSVTAATIVGQDSIPRKGIYSLRGLGSAILVPCDVDDSTQWTTIDGFALQEATYAILTGPSGDTILNAVSVKQTAGLDDYSSKLLFGDWLLWNDQFNGIQRYVSPQGFVAGRLANLSPEQSGLNKQIYAIAGSQRANSTAATYSTTELSTLIQAGIDVVTNPGGGGLRVWTCRSGHNSSSNIAVRGDNYTRLTNFIATSLNGGMGIYLGRPINQTLCNEVYATISAFLLGMYGQGMLANDVDDLGLPFSVVCGFGPGTNNPPNRVKLGILQSDVQVQYQAINEIFLINVEAGQTVTVVRQKTQTGQIVT
jgi:phage tail sheath protein FI